MSTTSMAASFPPQSFDYYHHQPQWPVDTKQAFKEDDDLSVLDEKILDPTTPADHSAASDFRKRSVDQSGHQASARDNMWHEVPQELGAQHLRNHSYPTIPHAENVHPFVRIDPTYASAYTQPHSYALSVESGTSTPTPLYEPVSHGFHSTAQMPFQGGHFTFNNTRQQPESSSAIPMSPQSSQGGWMSATSSDTAESRSKTFRNPNYRAASPTSHIRQDGIRKKNARFEIPAERNLHNIDSLIMQTNDEAEKKELKQQKRLLRNRQAALDSRQRKKQHTEKLEQEKKDFNNTMAMLEEQRDHFQELLHREREQWMHQREQFENYIRKLEFERDDAIRTKTLETADLRKMNNILKGHVRDFERQGLASMHNQSADFSNDFSSFDNLGIDDGGWDDDFALINNQDLQMEPVDYTTAQPNPPSAPAPKPVEASKSDLPFSLNAFYMCLLFGAFIASTSNSNSTSTAIQTSIPALSDEYRAESANVLKAVLASGPEQSHNLIPGPSHSAGLQPTTMSSSDMGRMTSHPHSGLERLHSSLTTPSRHQQESAAFSLSTASYSHLTNPDPFLLNQDVDGDDDFIEAKPSRLQTAYASMQEARQREGVDRVLGGESQSRSLLWERVPEKVLRDFRAMVERAQQQHQQGEVVGEV